MGEQRTALILLLILVSPAISITEIKIAEADSRTLVVPDDYPTIASAIGNATDGDVIFVKKGTYDGPVNQTLMINQTISLIGEDPETTILNLHPAWIFKGFKNIIFPTYGYDNSIEILANDVELSGFTITSPVANEGTSLTTGGNNTRINNNILAIELFLKGSNENIIQNNLTLGISGRGSNGTIAKNNLTGCRIGIASGNRSYTIQNNIINNNDGAGIHVAGSGNRIFNNTVTYCSYGVAIYGLYASNNLVYENILTNNTIGLRVATSGNNNTLYNNYIANNRYGVASWDLFPLGDDNIIYHNNFVGNTEQINTEPTIGIHSGIFDNGEEGNYWSDYNGTDNDGDGIGDTPYTVYENNTDHYPLMYPIALDITPPSISIISPQNTNYTTNRINLQFTVNEETSWMGYSLDEQNNITTTENTLNLPRLSDGSHNLTVYANDTAGNTGKSETINFTIETPSTTWVTAVIVIVATVGAAFLVYFLKIKKQLNLNNIKFPSWIILPLFLIATLFAILFRKKLFHQRS